MAPARRSRKQAAPDERLRTYRAKRHFDRTPEPAGAPEPLAAAERQASGGEDSRPLRQFVVQRHRARRLHYDFRLELDGVLVSWSVPKGPSLDPTARRLAVRVEDHPIEYLTFEGVIPAGDYGGGDVIVWDLGTWEPASDDPSGDLERGELHADLFGQKLRGRFAFVRRGTDGSGRDWLLVHKRDDHAVTGWRVEDHDRSVLSGLTNEQVARAPAAVWSSTAPAADAEQTRRTLPDGEDLPVAPLSDEELDALDQLGPRGEWEVQGRELHLTDLDRVLVDARAGRPAVTKRDLLTYLATAGPALVPFLRGRPLVRRRRGGKGSTWARTLPARAPEWLGRWSDGARTMPVVDDVPGLLWLANEGTVELHPWTARGEAPDEPTWALVDIDPGTGGSWDDTLVLARLCRTALDHLEVAAAAKVSGSGGIHIWIPLAPGTTFDDTQAWVRQLARAVGAVAPELVGGEARLDHRVNAPRGAQLAPWSPVLAAGAPVSVPIGWHELDDPGLRPDRWTIADAAERLARPDPFRYLLGVAQTLPSLDDLTPASH